MARYGFAVASRHLTSKFKLGSSAPRPHSRTGVSRLSRPQATYVPPDHIPSMARAYENGVGRVKMQVEGRWVKSPWRKEA